MEKNNNSKDEEWWEKRIKHFVVKHWTDNDLLIEDVVAGWQDGLIHNDEFVLSEKVKKIGKKKVKKKIKITDIRRFKVTGIQKSTPYVEYDCDRKIILFMRQRALFFAHLPTEIFKIIGGYMDDRSKLALKSTCHHLDHDRTAICAIPYDLGLSVRVVSPTWERATLSTLICPVDRSVASLMTFLDSRPTSWLEVESHVISPKEHKTGAPAAERASRFSQEYKKYMAQEFIQKSKLKEEALEELNEWLASHFPGALQFVVFHSSYLHNCTQQIATYIRNQSLIIDLMAFPSVRESMREVEGIAHMDTMAPVVARLVREVVSEFWTTLPLTKQTIDDLMFQLHDLNVSGLIKERLLMHFKGAAVMLSRDVNTIMTSCQPKLQQPNYQPLLNFKMAHKDDLRQPHHDLVFAFLKQIVKCHKSVYYDLPYLEAIYGLIQCLVCPNVYVHPVSACQDELFALLSPFTGEPAAPTYHEGCCRKYTQALTYHTVQGRKRCGKASKNYSKSIWPEWPESPKSEYGEGDMLGSDDLCGYCGAAPATSSFYGDDVCEDCRESQSFAFD